MDNKSYGKSEVFSDSYYELLGNKMYVDSGRNGKDI